MLKPLSANPTKWSHTLKQFLSVFDHFVGLALKWLSPTQIYIQSQQFKYTRDVVYVFKNKYVEIRPNMYKYVEIRPNMYKYVEICL